jgi:hypothetical protein
MSFAESSPVPKFVFTSTKELSTLEDRCRVDLRACEEEGRKAWEASKFRHC